MVKAAKRVQAANAKLVAFERGFISEEGIKDREWYRHLGVAPGKWLGMWFVFVLLSCSVRPRCHRAWLSCCAETACVVWHECDGEPKGI